MNHIILAAGTNKRFQHSDYQIKTLTTLNGKILLQYHIEYKSFLPNLDLYLVINQDFVSDFQDVKSNNPSTQILIQTSGSTLIDGLKVASKLKGPTLLTLGDEYIHNPNFSQIKLALEKNQTTIFYEDDCTPEEIQQTYSFDTNKEIALNFIEKPKLAVNKFRGTGHIVFSKESYDLIQSLPREIDDIAKLLNYISSQGHSIHFAKVGDKYHNINTSQDYTQLLETYEK